MYPLVFTTLGVALLAAWFAVTIPNDMAALNRVHADTYAANLWVYRGVLVAYQNDNFQTTAGFVPDTTLAASTAPHPTGYFPIGYQSMQTGSPAFNLWSNYFEGGTLYTFSSIPASDLPAGVIDAIFNRNGRSLMMGIKQTNSATTVSTVISAFNLNTPPYSGTIFTLSPTAGGMIPDGALVIVGN